MIRNNENGYTLLVTLAIILIITSFIGTLSFLTLNQQSQVENTDEDFLLSDITEMGIDYYRNRVLNDYVKVINKVEENIKKEIDEDKKNSTKLYDTEDELKKLEDSKELEGIEILIDSLSDYDEVEIDIEASKLTFTLTESPYEYKSNETYLQFKFFIEGSNSVNKEKYSFIIRLPKNLVDLTINHSDPGNGSGQIDYNKTIPTPNFSPPLLTEDCNGTYKNKTCISSSKFIKNIENSTVYFKDDISTNSANNTDFNQSFIIIDGNLDAKNFQGITDVSIFVNGDTSIDQLLATNINLYSSGALYLNKHININDSNIRSLGAVHATKKGMTISNTHMVLEGNDNIIDPFKVMNSSTVCIKNDSSLDELYIDPTSSVFILNSANRTGQNINGSKLPLIVDIDTFNKYCYGVSDSNGGIDVDIISDVNVTPESILNEIDYDVTD